jgi:hypothetical protein
MLRRLIRFIIYLACFELAWTRGIELVCLCFVLKDGFLSYLCCCYHLTMFWSYSRITRRRTESCGLVLRIHCLLFISRNNVTVRISIAALCL